MRQKRNKKNASVLKWILMINVLIVLVFLMAGAIYFQNNSARNVRVLGSTIANFQTISPLQESMIFSFSAPVDRKMVEKTFNITPDVLGEISWQDDKTCVFMPGAPLKNVTVYSIQFKFAGRPLPFFPTKTPEIYNLQFKTGEAPTVMSTSPLNFATNVSVKSSLNFKFTEEMNEKSFAEHFFIKPETTGKIRKINEEMIFMPTKYFLKNTAYTVGVLSGTKDMEGMQMIDDYMVNFITEMNNNRPVEFPNRAKIPILMFHNVGEWGIFDSKLVRQFKMPPENLKKILEDLAADFNTISLSQVYNGLTNEEELPEKPVVITFDDGWEGVYQYAYPILKKLNLKFTVFLITSHYEKNSLYLTKQQIAEMLETGLMEIGNHTVHHKMLATLDKKSQTEEINGAQEQLKNDFGIIPQVFAYPGGSYNKLTLGILEKAGFKAAVTVKAGGEQSENELLLLKRIMMEGGDTFERVSEKMEKIMP